LSFNVLRDSQVAWASASIPSGDTVPVQLDLATPDGYWFSSNQVTLAVDPSANRRVQRRTGYKLN